ncbi:MAG TPA: hypothetical protein VJ063_00995 [Verrucomicrobiae bacterium]|nr:hypothetical protein [Verrucomicrobiae bacterium]
MKTQRGFTRVEVAIVLASVTLIGATGFTVLGDTRERSERVVCANNLRQIGRAFNMWASDHGGENPFWTHYEDGGTYFPSGGTPPPGSVYNIPGIGRLPAALRNNAWFHFAVINQELRTPAVLVCPSEQNKVRGKDFSSRSEGYLSSTHQDRATSYLVGLHALQQYPSSILSGDRTLRADSFNTVCNANVGVASYISSRSGWVSGLHNGSGNLLLNDGHVEELSNAGLGAFLNPPFPANEDSPSHHFIQPQ